MTPFSLLTGLALVLGYALLGATWLVMKTEGRVQARARRLARQTGLGTLAMIGLFSLWTPWLNELYLQRWFAWPAMLYSGVVPVLVLASAYGLFRSLAGGRERMPFVCALGLFVLCYCGLLISFYPYVVPPSLTIEAVAAPPQSLAFLLVGAAFLLPLILAYTAYGYWVFRGKVDPEAGYH